MYIRLPLFAGVLLLGVGAGVLTHAPAAAQGKGIIGIHPDVAIGSVARRQTLPSDHLTLVADVDDDDADERPDGDAEHVSATARGDLLSLDGRYAGVTLTVLSGIEHARLVSAGAPVPWTDRIAAGTQVQGLSPGHVSIVARSQSREWALGIDVHGVAMRDGARNAVDMTRDHASIERTPPTRVDLEDANQIIDDPDALRLVVSSPAGSSLGSVTVDSLSSDGASLDVLRHVPMLPVPCDAKVAAGVACQASAPLRFVVDDVDRAHPLVAARSLRGEVGGAIVVRDASGRKLQGIRVGGPRVTPAGPMGRYRMTIRATVMRVAPGGAPAVGGTDAGAIAAIRQELALASATWGQCGITFGPSGQMDVALVDPPPPYLVALGDDVGLPASGGQILLRVEGRVVSVTTKRGWSTRQAALELQRAAQSVGLGATLSENARIAAGAAPSVDVAMKRADGKLARVELVSSSDPTLSVHVGAVDLSDGLQHFGDTDSVAGTIEERALVKSVDDGDPRTIEVIVVPFFGGGGRIGESFIGSDGSSLRNVVILDRAGVRARRSSLTLAHELGHVILDEPGHPDDYGVDTPTLLMDSDASDSSPFGPRRLTIGECARAIRQAGPGARVPLLTEWKFAPLKTVAPGR